MKKAEPYIIAREIFKSYRKGRIEVPVLRGASLVVEQGLFLALMGPSGSGKSTFVNLIGALALGDKGSLKVNGVELSTMSDAQRTQWRAHNVGLIFQRYHLIDVLSAEQNVEIPLLLHSMTKGERRDRVRHALELVGMADRAKHLPSELSGGQEQRIAIARALVADAPLLLCDEPTGNLDAEAGDDVLGILQSLSREFGKTIIMVTHNAAAAAIADKTLYMQKGILQPALEPDAVAMGGR